MRQLPGGLRQALELDLGLGADRHQRRAGVRLGTSSPTTLIRAGSWTRIFRSRGFSAPQAQLNELDLDGSAEDAVTDPVLVRVVEEPWPFPPNYPVAPQPLAALDLMDHPEPAPRRVGREVLASLMRPNRRCWAAARLGLAPLRGRSSDTCSS